ncbi:hypothetical protein BDZ97DRAFT_1648312 [Flammula alnicola]|nr:hypothetical protein BDZ97DRAFT_1648312 [Flammula alnicola]
MSKNQKPQGPRHVSVASIDTNASGIAESTISLGLSRFPEPPSSIPSTPPRSNSDSLPPNSTSFSATSIRSATELRKARLQERPSNPPVTSTRFANSGHSFKPTNRSVGSTADTPQPSSSSRVLSPYDWHDGASSIDVDATEDRLLPTSFITSLLQENKDLRKAKRASYASEAFSGISEMTYPPLVNRSGNDNMVSGDYSSGRIPPYRRPQDYRSPPSAYPQPTMADNRMSGDSETLHSVQGYPSFARTASPSKTVPTPGISVVGETPTTLHSNRSGSSQISSTQDSDTITSLTKGYQNKLSTTYETGDELTVDYKTFNPTYSPALPSTAGTQRRFLRDSSRQDATRNSLHSHQSAAPSFISRISGISLRRIFTWRKVKPLPPVPMVPDMSLAVQNAHRKQEESAPLADLVNRAGVLRDLLDKGQHPHDSLNSYHVLPGPDPPTLNEAFEAEARKTKYSDFPQITHLSPLHKEQSQSVHHLTSSNMDTRKRRRMWVGFAIVLIAALVAIGTGVGVTVGRKKQPQFNCSGNFTGSACNLDASCVCTSTSGCNGLAQNVIDLLPVVNQEFSTNITSSSAYSSIWMMQGSPTTGSCASQALLVDVGSGLDQKTYPNRTQWTQAALLWNAVQTQDMNSAQKMKNFVQALPWKNIAGADGPVEADSAFSTTISGFTYNFASQSLTEPPASFVTLGQPTNAQIAKVSAGTQATLDRMYSYAQASATQRQSALMKYWTSVLLQSADDLTVFKTALSVSPIMLPFNASSPSIRNLYVSSPSASFPPPLSCFPGLSNATLQEINTVESIVFGLQAAVSATQFNPACYPDRPIYGVLDVLRLRLPFLDSQTGVARQAVVLTRDANPRVVLHNGQVFSAISNATATPTTIPSTQLDPRQFGTLSLSDHVILQYLISIPDITIANALVKFVLDTTTKAPVPPDMTSALLQSLPSLPVLEVAVFGDVQPSDLTSTVSPFTNPSGSLFFGSPDGTALRNWTINSISGPVVWTQNATSPLVVRDKSLDPNTTITKTWDAASLAISFNVTNVTLATITTVLQGTNDFSP